MYICTCIYYIQINVRYLYTYYVYMCTRLSRSDIAIKYLIMVYDLSRMIDVIPVTHCTMPCCRAKFSQSIDLDAVYMWNAEPLQIITIMAGKS